jgi:toxin FitB
MIVLDTNVVSELMRPDPERNVTTWVAAHPRQELFTSTISEAEILYGVALLPMGARQLELTERARKIFNLAFRDRILAFDREAAALYAAIAAQRRSTGRPIEQSDAQIAAIARSRGAALATRNVRDFDGCGIDVVNPWGPPR